MNTWRWGCWIGLVIFAGACSSAPVADTPPTAADDNISESADVAEPASCDPIDDQIPLQPAADGELPFERLNFRPLEVDATEDTLSFKSQRYSFRFCKRDRTWGVTALNPAAESEEDYAAYFEALSEPDYETIADDDRTYQARVRLDASWLKDETASGGDDLEQVIFELIKPGDSQPISKVLYTNTEILERELGASAGVPQLTRSLVTDDALWWSIGFEQGEGASGVATLVQYDLATEELIVWQPDELGSAQITDLAVTGADEDLTLWLGTQYSGEGNPYLPAKGLVAYRPAAASEAETSDTDTLETETSDADTPETEASDADASDADISETAPSDTGIVESYTVENSPLVGAIPTRLWAEADTLWVASANGVCEVEWATVDTHDSWACWQFSVMADLPANQALYGSLLAETSMGTLETAGPVDLLWVTDTDISTPESTLRYEISYEPGITTQLNQGADYYVGPESQPDDGYFWWPGREWSWDGQRFVRYRDQVATNYVGGGPQGIGPDNYENYIVDWKTMRGEFELLDLTPDSTEITYYSAWIDGEGIEPWVTVTEIENPPLEQTNPTASVLAELKQTAE